MSTAVSSEARSRTTVGARRSVTERPPLAVCGPEGAAFEAGSFAARLGLRDWPALELMGRAVAFPRGSVLMYEGEPSERVMVLLEGRVKTTRAGVDGRELLVGIRGPGEILGALSVIDGAPRLTSLIALEPVNALVIDARAFRRHLDSSPAVMLALLEVLGRGLRDALLKRAEFPASDTIGRLAARLVELAERYGTTSERGIVIGLPLSQEELGGWVGACHAGLAKALQLLRELGWIETERRRIIVRDLDALRRRSV
jgi:CRP/FNR family transcriptional regulator, cyclic AMP receptor protein